MADSADPPEPAAPLNLRDAVGGPLGMAETSLPAVAFVIAYTASGSDTNTAAIVAVALALVLTVARLVKRESPQHALSGLVGVAFAAFIATRSGKAENFFLPGLLANAAYAAAFLISIAIRRPLVGVIVRLLDRAEERDEPEAEVSAPAPPEAPEDPAPARRGAPGPRPRGRAVVRARWLWAGVFLLRLVVQLPLYLAGAVVALGVARTVMGLPLFALALYLTWLQLRRPPTQPPAAA